MHGFAFPSDVAVGSISADRIGLASAIYGHRLKPLRGRVPAESTNGPIRADRVSGVDSQSSR